MLGIPDLRHRHLLSGEILHRLDPGILPPQQNGASIGYIGNDLYIPV